MTMVVAALVVDAGFQAAGLVPARAADIRGRMTEFSLNYTFWLNMVALAVAIWLFRLNRRHPMRMGGAGQHQDKACG